MYEHTIKRIWNGQSRTDIRISYASILTPQRYVKFQKGYAMSNSKTISII